MSPKSHSQDSSGAGTGAQAVGLGARGPILLGTLAGDTLARDTRQGRGASRVLLRVTSF